MRAKAASVVAVVCTGLVLAAVAWAGGVVTKVTIRPPNAKFGIHGRVFASTRNATKRTACTVGRTVNILKAKGPHESPKTDTVIDTVKTVKQAGHGFYESTVRPHAGYFYAQAVKTSGCRQGLSPLLHLTGA